MVLCGGVQTSPQTPITLTSWKLRVCAVCAGWTTGFSAENLIKKFTIENRLLAGLVLGPSLMLFAGV
jgi:uncharacterized membrane protein